MRQYANGFYGRNHRIHVPEVDRQSNFGDQSPPFLKGRMADYWRLDEWEWIIVGLTALLIAIFACADTLL